MKEFQEKMCIGCKIICMNERVGGREKGEERVTMIGCLPYHRPLPHCGAGDQICKPGTCP